ncbi:MAG: Gfo/Idh/MocA family protein [Armatimonadota bacterium]
MPVRRPIRVGVIRCDTHGYYFGAQMDPTHLIPPKLVEHNYICAHYYQDIYDPFNLAKLPKVGGFEIVACWDYDRAAAERFSETFGGNPRVCESVEEMAEGIDAVFISDCDGGGGDHLQLAAPFLSAGIPSFVDKPFASTLRDARALVRLARKRGTPMYNESILSVVPAADLFRRRFAEIGDATVGVIKGVGGAFSQENVGARDALGGIEDRLAYIIHGVALATNLFGSDVQFVEAMGTLPLEYLHLHTASGREVIILNTSVEHFPERCEFYAAGYSAGGAVTSRPIGDFEFIYGGQRILLNFKRMIRTGELPRPYDDMLLHIAIIEAGQIAQRSGRAVRVEDVLKGKVKLD